MKTLNRTSTTLGATMVAAAFHAAALGQIAFEAEPTFVECTPMHYPTRARLFDMDGDGRRDLVLPGRDRGSIINWAPVAPDGSFGTVATLQVDGQTDDAVETDVDGDGMAELVLAIRSYSGRVQVLKRAASGAMVPQPPVAVDREPRSLAAGDFDGDGDADLAVTCYGNDQVVFLRNDGSGGFSVSQRLRIDPWAGGSPGPQDTQAADVDADGRVDLVVGTIGTRRFQVFRGTPSGQFLPPASWLAPDLPGFAGAAVVGFDLGDIDADGDIDILAPMLATGTTQPLVAFLNDGRGGFVQRPLVGTVTGQVGYHWTASLADLDGDGKLDAVSSTALPGAVVVWRNASTGSTVSFQPVGRLDYTSFPRDLLCTNLDGDCDLDVVIADIAGHYAMGYRNLSACAAPMTALPPAARGADLRRPRSRDFPQPFAGAAPAEIAAILASGGFPAPPPAASIQGEWGFACSATNPSGPCDEVHPSPGCYTTPCCETVCGIVPDCCAISWDQTCVDLARSDCEGPPCPSFGGCETVHADPGCDDPDCCARITAIDGYCEGATWDWICAERANELCGLPPCTLAVPPGAVDEAEPCYKRLNDGATRAGESEAIACGQVFTGTCTTGFPRDTDWYSLAPGSAQAVTLVIDAEFPLEVHLMKGDLSGPLEAVESHFGGRCGPVIINRCLTPGAWHAVVTLGQEVANLRQGQPCTDPDPDNPPGPDNPIPEPGFDGTRYWLSLSCDGCGLLGDLDSDGRVSGADLGLLLGGWGTPGPGDLNGDGTVTGSDLGLLLGAWTGP